MITTSEATALSDAVNCVEDLDSAPVLPEMPSVPVSNIPLLPKKKRFDFYKSLQAISFHLEHLLPPLRAGSRIPAAEALKILQFLAIHQSKITELEELLNRQLDAELDTQLATQLNTPT